VTGALERRAAIMDVSPHDQQDVEDQLSVASSPPVAPAT
jgi:hypothetical protein